jgi:hypothetical protein
MVTSPAMSLRIVPGAFQEAERMLCDRAAAELGNNPAPMHGEIIGVHIEGDIG